MTVIFKMAWQQLVSGVKLEFLDSTINGEKLLLQLFRE